MSSTSKLDVAARAASYNVLLQMSLRASSFIMNGLILRYIQAELLGVVNLRLTLLYNTVLFLSREALRKACLSQTTEERKIRHVINLMWCTIPLGVVSSLFFGALWLSPYLEQPQVEGDKYGVLVFASAAVLELTTEPLWVLAQLHQHITLKVIAEGIPQLLKCCVIVFGVLLAPGYGLAIFLVGQLVYSLGYISIFYGYFLRVLRSHDSAHSLPVTSPAELFPAASDRGRGRWLNSNLTSLFWSFFKQSFLKQLLTDGEKYVMTVFGVLSFADQGIYDVINNLGSLAARFIFLPIEDSFYIFFASTLYRGEPITRQNPNSVPLVANTLSMLLKLVLLVALVILSFGYAYSYLALDIYGGRVLSERGGATLLRWYCVYVLLLAINGVTECFVFAAMSQAQVDRYNRVMLLFSLIFLTSSYFLTGWFGSVGFVLANCINMTARIIHSCHFITNYFSSTPFRPLWDVLPSSYTVLAFIMATVITTLSEDFFCCKYGWLYRCLHIVVGVVMLGVVGMVIGLSEPELVGFMLDRLPVNNSVVKQLVSITRTRQASKDAKKRT